MKMTSPFSAKLIVSVVTLLCLIHFSSGVRMLREDNYPEKLMRDDHLLNDKKDDAATTPATPDIGGFPFPFNFPPFPGGIPNIPSFNIPGFNIPGLGIPGIGGTGAAGDNNPFGIPIPGVPDVGNPGTGVPDVGNPGTGIPDIGNPGTGVPVIGNPGTGVPDVSVPAPGVSDVAVPAAGVPDAAISPPSPAP